MHRFLFAGLAFLLTFSAAQAQRDLKAGTLSVLL